MQGPGMPTAGELAQQLVAAWEALPKLYPPASWRPPPPAGYTQAQVGGRRYNPDSTAGAGCLFCASMPIARRGGLLACAMRCAPSKTLTAASPAAGSAPGQPGRLAPGWPPGRQRPPAAHDRCRAAGPSATVLNGQGIHWQCQAGGRCPRLRQLDERTRCRPGASPSQAKSSASQASRGCSCWVGRAGLPGWDWQ